MAATCSRNDQEVADLATRMRKEVSIKDRQYRFRTYRQCFVGHKAVSWLVSSGIASDAQDAVALGNRMMDLGLFHHVVYEHRFKDEYLFYRFSEDNEQAPLSPGASRGSMYDMTQTSRSRAVFGGHLMHLQQRVSKLSRTQEMQHKASEFIVEETEKLKQQLASQQMQVQALYALIEAQSHEMASLHSKLHGQQGPESASRQAPTKRAASVLMAAVYTLAACFVLLVLFVTVTMSGWSTPSIAAAVTATAVVVGAIAVYFAHTTGSFSQLHKQELPPSHSDEASKLRSTVSITYGAHLPQPTSQPCRLLAQVSQSISQPFHVSVQPSTAVPPVPSSFASPQQAGSPLLQQFVSALPQSCASAVPQLLPPPVLQPSESKMLQQDSGIPQASQHMTSVPTCQPWLQPSDHAPQPSQNLLQQTQHSPNQMLQCTEQVLQLQPPCLERREMQPAVVRYSNSLNLQARQTLQLLAASSARMLQQAQAEPAASIMPPQVGPAPEATSPSDRSCSSNDLMPTRSGSLVSHPQVDTASLASAPTAAEVLSSLDAPLLVLPFKSVSPDTALLHSDHSTASVGSSESQPPLAVPRSLHVNSSEPIPFESDLFKGVIQYMRLQVMLKGGHNTPPGLFEGKKRTSWIVVQGKFKVPCNYDDVVTGQEFFHPLRNLPAEWFVEKVLLSMAKRISPSMKVALRPSTHMLMPIVASAQSISVCKEGEQKPPLDSSEDMRLVCPKLCSKHGDPVSANQRKAYFLSSKNRAGCTFDTEYVWTFHFWQQYVDIVRYCLDFGYTYDLIKHLNGNPLQAMVKDTGSGKYLYNFAFWHQRLLPEASSKAPDSSLTSVSSSPGHLRLGSDSDSEAEL